MCTLARYENPVLNGGKGDGKDAGSLFGPDPETQSPYLEIGETKKQKTFQIIPLLLPNSRPHTAPLV